MRRTALLLALAAGLALGAAGTAHADVAWLCKPGMADNPCAIPQDTTIRSYGEPDRVETPPVAADKPVDCFYVYPTVSNQLTANATKARDPELVSIAKFQAARFDQHCRVFAPIYRQRTLASIATGYVGPRGGDGEIAFADVLEAWRAYLAQDNGGRGVVLIGHSQGASMLRQLLRREIEREPGQLRRVVSALLIGATIGVEAGKAEGGDFRHVPLCTARAQLGCFVAFSTFAEDPPSNARFGRPPASEPGGPELEAACVDPRRLVGSTAPLRLLTPSEPYAPGPIAAGIVVTARGLPPTAPTTWVVAPDRFEGGCARINGAHVLRYEPIGQSRRPAWFPEPSWGTHLVDVNLLFEPLVALVGEQAARWTRPDVRLTRRCVGGGRLRVRLEGRDAGMVRDVNFKFGKRLVARAAAGPFVRTVGRQALARTRAKQLRAVAYLKQGEAFRTIAARPLPRCGVR